MALWITGSSGLAFGGEDCHEGTACAQFVADENAGDDCGSGEKDSSGACDCALSHHCCQAPALVRVPQGVALSAPEVRTLSSLYSFRLLSPPSEDPFQPPRA